MVEVRRRLALGRSVLTGTYGAFATRGRILLLPKLCLHGNLRFARIKVRGCLTSKSSKQEDLAPRSG
jgi:hypothetical protein